MIRSLTILGIVLVLLGGGIAASSSTSRTTTVSGPSQDAPDVNSQSQNQTGPSGDAAAGSPVAAPVTNRADCGQIRGTSYLSAEERTWYLTNCTSN